MGNRGTSDVFTKFTGHLRRFFPKYPKIPQNTPKYTLFWVFRATENLFFGRYLRPDALDERRRIVFRKASPHYGGGSSTFGDSLAPEHRHPKLCARKPPPENGPYPVLNLAVSGADGGKMGKKGLNLGVGEYVKIKLNDFFFGGKPCLKNPLTGKKRTLRDDFVVGNNGFEFFGFSDFGVLAGFKRKKGQKPGLPKNSQPKKKISHGICEQKL